MLPIILALFDRAPGDRSRPTALHGQFGAGGPSRSEVRSDLTIIVRRSESPLATTPRRARCLASCARMILSRTAQHLSYPPPLASCPHDPGCASLSSTRISTGVRTHSGEERDFLTTPAAS